FASVIQPQFIKSPKGMLLTAVQGSYRKLSGDAATVSLQLRIEYQNVSGFLLPKRLHVMSYDGRAVGVMNWASVPARFSTAKATSSPACSRRGSQANRCDDQIRALQADPVGENAGQGGAHEAAAEDPDRIQRHHAAAHVVAGPELQGPGDGDIEDAARH